MAAVLAIHARENGVGTLFPPEPGYDLWLEQAKPRHSPSRTPSRRALGSPDFEKSSNKNAASWLR